MEKEKQLPLLSESKTKRLYGGPVFEAGPGWGERLGKWLKRLLARPALPFIAIVILLIGIFLVLRPNKVQDIHEIQTVITITETVVRGDSYALIARRILANYTSSVSDQNLTNGQKLFIEETLRRIVADQTLAVGAKVMITTQEIEEAISEAEKLKEGTLRKWEELSKKVKFK